MKKMSLAIKFYVKQHSKSDLKYSLITNKGDIGNILITCAKVVPLLLREYPNASFGFLASRSIDPESKKVEGYYKNQRFKTYVYLCLKKFGSQTFEHIAYEKISSYLLVNKKCGDVEKRE